MAMLKILTVICIFVFVHITPCDAAYGYHSTKILRGKILTFISEMMIDAKKRVENVQHIRRMYYHTAIYQNGELIYDLRKTFRRMLHCYNQSWKVDAKQKFNLMIEIHKLHLDVEQVVYMMLEDRLRTQKRSERHDNYKVVLRSGQSLQRGKIPQIKGITPPEKKMKIGWHQPDLQRPKFGKNRHILEEGFESDRT